MQFSAGLQALLVDATDKANWSSILNTALGTTKRARFFDGATECRNVAMANTGVTTTNAGLSLPGAFSNNTASAASNFAAGNGTVRIEGGGHTITLTLGLTGSGKELILGEDLPANGAIGNKGITLVPPATLPDAVVVGIEALVIQFGPTGSPQTLTIAEQVYTGMSVGFAGATQSRWRANPITVPAKLTNTSGVSSLTGGNIVFTLFPGLDSDGRADCWIYADWQAHASGNTGTANNREFSTVDLIVTFNGVQPLWDGTTTYTCDFQRGATLRWESAPLPWNVTTAHINQLIADGKVMKHKCDNVFAGSKPAPFPDNIAYRPFKQFGSFDIAVFISDQERGTPGGGERDSVGLVHEWFARTVAEVGTHGNQAFATAARVNSLRRIAESIANYPLIGGMLSTVNHRLLDPSDSALGGPYFCHRDSNSPGGVLRLIPQAQNIQRDENGVLYPAAYRVSSWVFDTAHSANIISYYAFQFSNDPWHLALTQAMAVANMTCTTYLAGQRGSDGKTNMISVNEERGYWWGVKSVAEAWKVTPSTAMPKPFLDRSFFANVMETSLQWIRDKYISPVVDAPLAQTVIGKKATNFWGVFAEYDRAFNGVWYLGNVGYMNDYGHITACHILRMGYSNMSDVAQYYSKNAKLRAQMGGDWYNADEFTNPQPGYPIAPSTGTDLPYTDLATYKSWYKPGLTDYHVDGDIDHTRWAPVWNYNSANYTYIFMGALQCYKYLSESGLLPVDWDATTEHNTWMAHLLNPTNITNKWFASKHMFEY